MLICASAILLLSVFHCLPGSLAESFYELLGIDHDADLVTIRRAFKRVALVKHPDKNQDDPDAHSAFIRINRAYEVLKDEEKRRKYDQFGEEGLGDGDGGTGGAGQQYQSWHYYKENFGIYDDDPEVHTLSRADFHEEVFDSGEIWFVNFFSAHCSHCHQLAPAWRELARQVPEGVAQIGAVNCAEDPGLCQSQRVTHYPSLLLYPRLEWFQGAREIASLLQFLLSRLPAPVLRPTEAIALPIKRPLLVEHCPTGASEDDCLSEEDRQKVAAIAFKLGIDFALFDYTSGIAASEAETICQTIGHNSGLFVLQEGHPSSKELFFADMADLRSQLLAELPPLPELDETELEWLIHRPPDGENNEAVLGLLVGDQQQMEAAEWRLLGQLAGLQARLVPCHRLSDICANLQQTGRLPRPVLFRPQGGYDIHYGNNVQIRDVAKFIRRSTSSTLVVLDSEKYWEARNSGDLWLIDHFAPWCPPCLRLLNELRKLPATVEGGKQQLRVGSLDCEANREICQQEGVNSYPRTMLFTEDGGQHTLVGYHPVEELLEFITETIHPSVQQLDSVAFKEKIHARPAGSLFFVDFFAPWCGPCQQLAPEFRRLARQWAVANPDSQISFGSVDCDQNGQLCDREGVRSYPTLRLYRHSDDFAPIDYPQNWWRNSQTMAHWLAEMQPSLVAKLAGDFANTVLDSTKPFLVDFYAPWCSHCIQFAPTFERLAKLLEGQIHLGKVDCERFGWICQSAGIKAFPSVALFAGAVAKGQRQSPLDWMPVQHGPDAEKIAQQVRELVAARRNSISRDEL